LQKALIGYIDVFFLHRFPKEQITGIGGGEQMQTRDEP
jgi:hypothetical protein